MELQILVHVVDVVENVLDNTWDNALQSGIPNDTFHSMGFAGRCLPVGKDGAVIPVENICNTNKGIHLRMLYWTEKLRK